MQAFQGSPAIQAAFIAATLHIANRVGTQRYLGYFRRCKTVAELFGSVLEGYVPAGGDAPSYAQFGIPDKVILLFLSLLRGLPHRKRQAWLEKLFQSIAVGADLEQMRVWPKYVFWVLLREMPKPTEGSDDPKDKVLHTARQAVGRVVVQVMGNQYDSDALTAASEGLRVAKAALFDYLRETGEIKGTSASAGADHPLLAAVQAALPLIIQSRDPRALSAIGNLVMHVRPVVSIQKQAAALGKLVVSGAI